MLVQVNGSSSQECVDLSIHDLPQEISPIESWELNGYLKDEKAREYSIFAAFFRHADRVDSKTGKWDYAYSCTWSITDIANQSYLFHSSVDAKSVEIALETIRAQERLRNSPFAMVLAEMLKQGRVPLPDRMFDGPVKMAIDRLSLDFAGTNLEKHNDGSYLLLLRDQENKAGCDLRFIPQKSASYHGDNDLIHNPFYGQDLFDYVIPRCLVEGSIVIHGTTLSVEGQGWYERQFNSLRKQVNVIPKLMESKSGQLCFVILLDNNHELIFRLSGDGQFLTPFVHVDSMGQRHKYREVIVTPKHDWRSTRTFNSYSTQWRLIVPQAKIDLHIKATVDDQELITCISKSSFWKGSCEVHGTAFGQSPIKGIGYVEQTGFGQIHDLDEFFAAVGAEAQNCVSKLLPKNPSYDQMLDLIANPDRGHWMDGINNSQLSQVLFKPIREIIDRGGKAWRSYAAVVCCDAVGGDSRKYMQLLSAPELMHVGSLIVDDVEDRSTIRRGGPACHLIYGEPLAINAGSAAYFFSLQMLLNIDTSSEIKLKIIDLALQNLRVGHAGQAIDLDGLTIELDAAAISGNSGRLERAVLARYRFKCAIMVSNLARIGAILGGGSDIQIEALGDFFETVGLAFQIIDDVLNLRGFRNELKERGEDIRNGTVTLPIAKAMERLDATERHKLVSNLKEQSNDPKVINRVIQQVEECGAIEACNKEAHQMVDSAWYVLDPLLPDSIIKIMLRCYSQFLLERHY